LLERKNSRPGNKLLDEVSPFAFSGFFLTTPVDLRVEGLGPPFASNAEEWKEDDAVTGVHINGSRLDVRRLRNECPSKAAMAEAKSRNYISLLVPVQFDWLSAMDSLPMPLLDYKRYGRQMILDGFGLDGSALLVERRALSEFGLKHSWNCAMQRLSWWGQGVLAARLCSIWPLPV
jgi:hypothetical protein